MKRNSLTTALIAGLAGAAGIAATAQAVNVNSDGVGGALIYPYYTVNRGNTTLISVVNTTSVVKAVKVRFLEGRNSREVLDFNLYMSPFDVWVAAIAASDSANANSPGRISTPDTSCTVPGIPTGGVDFRTFAYDGAIQAADHNATQLPGYSSPQRTREGYVELFEMGEVSGPLAIAATHTSAGIPANCTALLSAWAGGIWATTNGTANVSIPRGGLYGSGQIVNVAEGTLYSYDPIALEGFYTNATNPAALHTEPGSLLPNLGSADSGGGASRSIVVTNNGTNLVQDLWTPASPLGAAGGWNSVSALFQHNAIFNEYLASPAPGTAFSSEWVITFPTKRFYVDRPSPALRPFRNIFFGTTAAPGSCEDVLIRTYDREERTSVTGVNFSPLPPNQESALCYEAQVVTFNQALTRVSAGFNSPSAILGSVFAENINPAGGSPSAPFTAGHVEMGFFRGRPLQVNQSIQNPISGNVYRGLPVIGFWVQRTINNNVGGVLANYGGTFDHKYSRDIVSGTAPTSPQ